VTVSRRRILRWGGGIVAALSLPVRPALAGDIVEIVMQGRGDGSRVWFDPIGVLIEPGQSVRWTNRNPGNSHTSTAYNPQNFGRPLRMPKSAEVWNSDYLLPDESFSVTLSVPGVYDYYCVPHEHAGMVGRIVVGAPESGGWMDAPDADGDLPDVALKAFPAVEDIMRDRIVRAG
jgi:plastocyanin